jgi:hypothetical protein
VSIDRTIIGRGARARHQDNAAARKFAAALARKRETEAELQRLGMASHTPLRAEPQARRK